MATKKPLANYAGSTKEMPASDTLPLANLLAALTAYVSGAGTVTSSDTLLTALQKLDGNIAAANATIGSIQVGNNLFNYYNFR